MKKNQTLLLTGDLATRANEVNELGQQLLKMLDEHTDERETALIQSLENKLTALRDELHKDIERAQADVRLSGAPEMGTDEGQWSMIRAARGMATGGLDAGNWKGCELEREVGMTMRDQILTEKALAIGIDTGAGYIVPENYVAQILELFNQNNPLIQLGARLIPGVTGSPLVLPKQTARATAVYTPEGNLIPDSQPELGQIKFTPRTLTALVKINNVLRENANPAIDAFVREDIGVQFQNALTNYGLLGDGTGGSPVGVINEPDVNTLDFSIASDNPASATAEVTYNALINMIHRLMEDNALMGSLGWVFNPAVLRDIWQMVDQDIGATGAINQQLARRVLAEGAITSLLGYSFQHTTALPATGTSIVFGDWSRLLIPTWKVMELRASQEAGESFERDQTWVRALMRHDMGITHPESFCVGTDFLVP